MGKLFGGGNQNPNPGQPMDEQWRKPKPSLLGILGDTILIGRGQSPVYAPQFRNKVKSAALEGFADNPMQAIDRLRQAGFNDDAVDLYNQMAKSKASLTNQTVDNNRALDPYVGGLIRASRGRPENYPAVKKIIETLKTTRGYDAPFDLPETYSDEWANSLEYFGYTPSQLTSMDNNIRSTDTSTENNKRTTETSRDNNIRTTETSRENNIRTTGTSAANNRRTTATSERNNIRSNETSRDNNAASNATRRETAGSGRRTPPALPPRPPKGPGDRLQGPGGLWVSKDGKTWTPPS